MADDGGLSKLQRRLARIPAEVKKAVEPALLKQAHEMADTMERFAPKKSGDLAGSIAVTGPGRQTPAYSQPGGSMVVPENAVAITVGDQDVRYAHLVEYGHKASGFSSVDVPAQPFFWPAVRLHQKRARNVIRSAVTRAVKKSGGGS